MLIDGNSLTYRAFFALPTDMATASGQVTNAVFGFTSMLLNLVRDHRPDRVVVTFDLPQKTFRHEMVDTYKANRDATPDILRQQMGLVRQVVDTLQLPVVTQPGYEADDVIATLAMQAEAAGDDVIIVTGDRDSYQLVRDPHVRVLYNKRGVSDYALLRRGRHPRAHRRPPRAVRVLRGAAGRSLRQPARRARCRREDRRQADQQVRRPGRHLRQRRGPDAEAAREPDGPRAAGTLQRRDDDARARRRTRHRPRGVGAGRLRHRRGARAVQVPGVPVAGAAAPRGLPGPLRRRRRSGAARGRGPRGRGHRRRHP